MIDLRHGDCREVLRDLPDASVHCCVTDPPYHLTNNTGSRSPLPGQYTPIGRPREPKGGFMGKQWDGGDVAFQPDTWREVLRVLKPGGHLVAFGGTRTSHRMACAIEDAGFEIRDTLCWLYGSGFPKSHDVSRAIDRAAGATREVTRNGTKQIGGFGDDWDINSSSERERRDIAATPDAQRWQGWGTSLKPAHETIVLARRPLHGTVAQNVLAHGTGAINVDACRVALNGDHMRGEIKGRNEGTWAASKGMHTPGRGFVATDSPLGRWPANVLHDGSDEVEAAFAAFGERTSGILKAGTRPVGQRNTFGNDAAAGYETGQDFGGDAGSASRFFYSAKATAADRADSRHPTVKPIDLMRWLVRLVCPPGGTVLDPFAGSGTTGEAAMLEGFGAILIEQDAQHVADIRHRMHRWSGEDLPLFASPPPAEPPEDARVRELFEEPR